jgi:thioredoxin reductase (NADPH)
MHDLIVVGAGPVGLACALSARREGLSTCVIEKGTLVNALYGYPTNMEFFSTPDLIEIGGHPFPTQHYKPVREEALEYYRRVAQAEELDVRLYERVTGLTGEKNAFMLHTERGTYPCCNVVLATGFFDLPNRLHVPGEELPKVTHYYKEPYAYVGQRVAVVGAKNSAAKAALDCYRHGAQVTLVVRGPALSTSIKYWIRPDLENRIREGAIRAFFNSTVARITPEALHLDTPDGPMALENDWVLAMTGYRPDFDFLATMGVTFADDAFRTPVFDAQTYETARPGLYLAGTVCGGLHTSRWFIENGRFHARQIAAHIAGGAVTLFDPAQHHWKTAE